MQTHDGPAVIDWRIKQDVSLAVEKKWNTNKMRDAAYIVYNTPPMNWWER